MFRRLPIMTALPLAVSAHAETVVCDKVNCRAAARVPGMTAIGLIDCNNFCVCCERAFDPKLVGIPVVVASNNDGCAIARSNEVKALGVKMGDPIHLIRDRLDKHGVVDRRLARTPRGCSKGR